MKLFLSYLKSHLRLLLMLALFGAVSAAVLLLYKAPLEGALYALLLCLALGLGFLTAGFLRYRRKHRALQRALLQLPEGLPPLPEPQGVPEADYQALLTALDEDRRQIAARAARDRDRLTYQRLGSDTTDLVLKACDLDTVIRAAVKEYARLFILKKLILSFTPTGLTVLTDKKWLGFVIGQLLSNALKYTQTGGVSVYAQGQRLIIEDTGVGIPPEELPRIFEKSFTGENGRAAERTTGLGLYLCRRACALLGHRISAESEVGKGTKVILDLTRPELPTE